MLADEGDKIGDIQNGQLRRLEFLPALHGCRIQIDDSLGLPMPGRFHVGRRETRGLGAFRSHHHSGHDDVKVTSLSC